MWLPSGWLVIALLRREENKIIEVKFLNLGKVDCHISKTLQALEK